MDQADPTNPLPRYYQIYSALLASIESGSLRVGDVLPAERQIAEQYGVARLTVVKALDLLEQEGRISKQQGRGNFVLPHVKAALKTIAYVKSAWPVHRELEGMSQIAFENSYQLQLLAVHLKFGQLESYLRACIQNGVAGLIIYARTGYEDIEIYRSFLNQGIPLVMIDRYYPELETDSVVFDDEKAAFELTEKFLLQGHQRIAIVPGYETQTTSVRGRLAGYHKALRQYGACDEEALIWSGLYTKFGLELGQTGQSKYRQAFYEKLTHTRPTAIITINDGIYESMSHDLSALESQLMSLNDDAFAVELATFSYNALPEHSNLKFLALQPGEELGKLAAQLLIKRLEGAQGRKTDPPLHVKVPMTVLELDNSRWAERKEAKLSS